MERNAVDYFIKVVVPLLAILAIAYLSIYIRQDAFEAMITLQVTALLSAIALYFSIYKPVTDYATLSDRIFLFTYFSITFLMTISIVKSTNYVKNLDKLRLAIDIMQRYAFPVFVLLTVPYVLLLKSFSA